MTISSTTIQTEFSGDGSTTSFDTDFVFWATGDVHVILVSSSGGETDWTEGTEYSISGGDGATGTVTASTGPTDYTPASGERLVLRSDVANLQETDLTAGGSFATDDVEKELDRLARRVQQNRDFLDRGMRLTSASTVAAPFTIPTPSSGRVLGWSSSGAISNLDENSSAYLDIDGELIQQGVHTIPIPAGSFVARLTNGATLTTTELATNDVILKTYDFTASSSVPEAIQFNFPAPKSWDEGTLTGEHYWTCTSSSATGDVVWSIRGQALGNDDAMDASWGTAQTVTDSFIAKNDLHVSSAFSAMTLGGTPAEDDLIVIEVGRASDNANDTLATEASYIGLRLKFTINAKDDA